MLIKYIGESSLSAVFSLIKAEIAALVSAHNSSGAAHGSLFGGKADKPSSATALPASGTALADNTIYTIPSSAAVGTYQFAAPASGQAHGTFYTAATFAITFATGAKYLGAAPGFGASKQYEFDVLDGVWMIQEVAS